MLLKVPSETKLVVMLTSAVLIHQLDSADYFAEEHLRSTYSVYTVINFIYLPSHQSITFLILVAK